MRRLFAFDHGHKRSLILLTLLLSTIGISNTALASPQIAESQAIQSCQYLEEIEGSSGYGKNYNWTVLAKHSVLTKAEKLGASHVVWERFYPIGAFNGIAVAKVYHCNI